MESPTKALLQWSLNLPLQESPDQGLINGTWILGTPPQYVLQWVNPIFSPLIHSDLAVVTQHLQKKGFRTPILLRTQKDELCWKEAHGCWRIWSYIPGATIHKLKDVHTARLAGEMVGRFHAALSDLDHSFIAPRRDVHNTPHKMKELEAALNKAKGHPLEKEACSLGAEILKAWSLWDGTLKQPLRICHGDLKISNLRFSENCTKGICLIDLDTIGPQAMSVEMGDAWRSWCNPAGESNPDHVYFDIDLFESSARAWAQAAPELASLEKQSMAGGIERICLELSARFCADTINNNYFKENLALFPQKGQHNYIRALGQYKLAQSAKQKRSQCESILRSSYKEKK